MTKLQKILSDNPALAQLGPKWLAEHVAGGVNEKSWRHWAKGRGGRAVEAPDDVIQAVNLFVNFLNELKKIERPAARKPGVRPKSLRDQESH